MRVLELSEREIFFLSSEKDRVGRYNITRFHQAFDNFMEVALACGLTVDTFQDYNKAIWHVAFRDRKTRLRDKAGYYLHRLRSLRSL